MLYYESMQIKTYLHEFFLIFILFTLVSCSSIELPAIPNSLPEIYKIDIQQGNEITSEMLMKLKPGMTKAQVRFVLGTPLIQDTFHSERWDYIYIMKVNDIVIEKRHVILNFLDEKLKNITGEVVPKFDDSKQNNVVEKKVERNNKKLQFDEEKGNNEMQISKEELDTSESINEAIKQDIIDSLPEKDDAGYFDLLLEKIGF
jgi:outer membrane protein assembly factor BamE